MHPVDQVQLSFDQGGLFALNIILGLIMFGVSLDLSIEDFKRAAKSPKAPLAGMLAQFLIMPALTFCLILILSPPPSIALGMILVASCPGGNVSNFIVHTGKGDTALSVTMTAISTAAAVFMTPLNVGFWGSMRPGTASILQDFSIGYGTMFKSVFVLLGIPLVTGMITAHYLPRVAQFLRKPFKVISILFFFVFIAVAFYGNMQHFTGVIGYIFIPVLLQNALSLTTGYLAGLAAGLESPQRRALCIEVGIQNSGLGLVLIFSFFGGLGGMAVIAAWWGIWHIIAGLSVAGVWVWRGKQVSAEPQSDHG